jgi:hypothetical protein
MSDNKLKELFRELDLPEELADKELDEIKTGVFDKFVARAVADSDPDIVKRITGGMLGKFTNLAKQNFGLEGKDVEGKKFEEVLELGATKTKSEIEALKKQLEGKNPDNKEWEEKIGAIAKERDQFKTMAETLGQEFEGFKTTALNNEKNLKIGFVLNSVRSGIEWSDAANDLAKKGFDAHISENYKFDFDEKGDLAVFGKDGNKIDNGKKTGFLTPAEVFKKEAAQHGLLKMAPTPPKPGEKKEAAPITGAPQFQRKLPTKAAEIAAS